MCINNRIVQVNIFIQGIFISQLMFTFIYVPTNNGVTSTINLFNTV